MTKASLLELLKAGRKRRFREQTGTVVRRSDGFYIRYYKDGDGGVRTKFTERLCDLATEATSLRLQQRSFMSGVNSTHHTALHSPTEAPAETVGGFWSATYLPWVLANRRWSTHRGYKNIWKQYLKDELGTKALSEYRTVEGSQFLTRLAAKLNRNSLAHVRSLMSGIFSHATSLGIIDRNPMRDVKVLARVRPPKPRVKYTPEETVAIINAIPRTDAKLFFAFCAVLGMRPSEAAGVKWENISDGVLMVREAAPYGHSEDGLKTERSKRDLNIIEPVLSLIKAWHATMGKPASGLLFENSDHNPIDHNSFNKYQIKPHAKKVCARYCGPYSGRHGAATTLYNLTGDMRAAYQVAGNSFEVLVKNYVEADDEQGKLGLAKYEQALLNAMSKG
jgi:integrase